MSQSEKADEQVEHGLPKGTCRDDPTPDIENGGTAVFQVFILLCMFDKYAP